jgi:hypothetical protein
MRLLTRRPQFLREGCLKVEQLRKRLAVCLTSHQLYRDGPVVGESMQHLRHSIVLQLSLLFHAFGCNSNS